MKTRHKFIIAFSLLGLFGASFASIGASSNEIKASSSTEYVDLGPGVANYDSPNYHDAFNGLNYSISYRNTALMLFPNRHIYSGIEMGKAASENDLSSTNFDLVRVYTSETQYSTLSSLMSSVAFNVWQDASENVSIFISPGALEAVNIYKIVFSEGFILPYPDGNYSTKYAIKETLTFKFNHYHNYSDRDIVESFNWTKTTYSEQGGDDGEIDEGIEIIPIAAMTRTSPDYKLHIRGEINGEYDESALSVDDGSCRLTIFFGENDYNAKYRGLASNTRVRSDRFDLSPNSETSYLKTLYSKILLHTVDGESLSLLQVADPFEKGLPIYDAWGEYGCISFDIGNKYAPEAHSYCATDFVSLTILRGAQFPSYEFTNAFGMKEYRYEQIDDITVDFSPYKKALWCTTVTYAFNAANIEIETGSARNIALHKDGIDIEGTAIDFKLSESNYEGVSDMEIITLGEKLTRFIYLNGRSLYYSFNINQLKAYANLDGAEETISIIVPIALEDINEIIIQRGASVPSLVASKKTMEIYGGYVSYYVLSSRSYTRNGDSFIEDSKITWTLWFDGANPIKVSNASTFDFELVPPGETTNAKKFLYWMDENGDEAAGYLKITSGREYFGKYAYSYYVTLKGIDNEYSLWVEDGTRLTTIEEMAPYLIPQKNGHVFQGWVDENGNHFNIDNRIKRDIVLTATWVENPSIVINVEPNMTAGMVIAVVIIGVAAIALVAVDILLIVLKRKA
ncbi:MAG: hypothetical protein IJ247_00880 [Bacilli bacterium]|nr:hypothetical protein [Bacilli bacterium]